MILSNLSGVLCELGIYIEAVEMLRPSLTQWVLTYEVDNSDLVATRKSLIKMPKILSKHNDAEALPR